MTRILLFMCAFIFLLYPLCAAAADVQSMIDNAYKYAQNKNYRKAFSILDEAHDVEPKNIYIDLARVRISSWKGDYAEAQAALDKIYFTHKDNADVQLMQGYLHYYKGDAQNAKKVFEGIVASHPEYTDARDGLTLVRKKDAASEEADFRWQIDAGYEYSHFSRRPQPAWNQEFIQINRFFSDRRTVVHGKITRYDQFTNIDSEYEIGADHFFFPWLSGYLYSAFSPEADFRPDWRFMAGGAGRVFDSEDLVPIWITMDLRRDNYEDTSIVNINPGLRIEPYEGWAVSVKKISVDAEEAKRVYGEEFRLDGQFREGMRFNIGYADAPETVAAVTVDTKTYFGGIAADFGDSYTARLNYTHDDRENSWERSVFNASISYRF